MTLVREIDRYRKNVGNLKITTGWSSMKTMKELLKARKLGISISELEQDFKISKQIEEILLLSGENQKSIEALLKKIKAKNIKYSTCKTSKLWLLTDEELDEFAQLQIAKKQKLKEEKVWYIKVACERSGKTYEEMSRKLRIVNRKKYTNSMFISTRLYTKSDKELLSLPTYVKKVKPETRESKEKKKLSELRRNSIMEEMNWSFGKLKNEFLKASIYGGEPSLKEYYHFGLYKMSTDEMKTYLTAGNCRKMIRRYADYKNTVGCFQDKAIFNVKFNEFVSRKWITTDNLTLDQFKLFVQELDSIIVKPTKGIEGRGIKKYYFDKETNIEEIYEEIINNQSIIEECVVQHEDIGAFWNETLNTMRIITFVDKGVPQVLCAVLKLGTNKVADNFAAGGIACGIDMDKGMICTDGVDSQGKLYTVHPLSEKQFRGFLIPHWDKVINTCKEAAMVIKENPFVGWDVSLTKEGNVELIEGNHDPGGYLSQFPFAVSEHKGIGYVLEPYLHF